MKDTWMSDAGSRPSSSASRAARISKGSSCAGVGFQDRVAHATERFLKRHICIDPGADERGIHQRADHALRIQLRAIGHRGGDANVIASAPGHQQRLEACQQRHEQRRPSAMAQRAQARDQSLFECELVRAQCASTAGRFRCPPLWEIRVRRLAGDASNRRAAGLLLRWWTTDAASERSRKTEASGSGRCARRPAAKAA